MTNAIAPAQMGVFGNFLIQVFHALDEGMKGVAVKVPFIGPEAVRIEFRNQFKEAKAAAQDVIADRYGIGHTHHADNINILRYRKGHAVTGKGYQGAPVRFFHEQHEFAKNLAYVAAVNVINDKKERFIRHIRCALAKAVKNTVLQFIASTLRFIAGNEVFVCIVFMEMDKFNTAIILFPHHGVGNPLCRIGFANARCPLKDNILLVL